MHCAKDENPVRLTLPARTRLGRSAARALSSLSLVLALASCKTEEKERCRRAYAGAQSTVKRVRSGSLDSLREADGELARALADCRAAGLDGEVGQLEAARKTLLEQIERARRPEPESRRRASPEEIARLEREGDPSCPEGQAYKHRTTGKEIRCTGPLPIDMGSKRARDYFLGRDYRVRPGETPAALVLEHGGELLVLAYDRDGDDRPPKCVVLYPPEGTSWQEATARITGTPPWKLGRSARIRTRRGALPLVVEDHRGTTVIRIGACEGVSRRVRTP